MRVLTVVPSVERFDLVRTFEKSYASTAPPGEPAVFVVMGSDDDTAGYLNSKAATGTPYAVLRAEQVLPFAKAVDAGVQVGLERFPETDVIVVANDDLVLRDGWYGALAEAIDGGLDIVGAKLVYPKKRDDPPDSPHKLQHFGKWFSLDFYPFHVLRGLPETHERAQNIIFVPDVTFAFAAIRRDVWEKIGGLDESYPSGFEDDDLCLRAKEQGCLIGVHPGFSAVHLESATTGQDTDKKAVGWERFAEVWLDSGRVQWALGVFQGWRT